MSQRGVYWMTGISTVVAVAALAVSIATFVVGERAEVTKGANAEAVANALGASEIGDVRAGRTVVRQNSFGDQYLYTLTRLWEAAEANGDQVTPPSSSPTLGVEGWTVCSATLVMFGGGCHVLSDFQYSDTGQVDTFSIDDVPLADLVQFSWNDPSSKDTDEFEIRVEGVISSPDLSSTTYLFRLNPSRMASNTLSTKISSPMRQDIGENRLEGGTSVPDEVVRFKEPYGFVTLPGTAGGFLYLCSEFVPAVPAGETAVGCQWSYF